MKSIGSFFEVCLYREFAKCQRQLMQSPSDLTLTPTSSDITRKRQRESPLAVLSSKKIQMEQEKRTRKVGDMHLGDLLEMLNVSLGQLLEGKLADVAKKRDVEAIRAEIRKVEKDNQDIRTELQCLTKKLEDSERRWEDLSNRTRRNNVIVQGLDISGEESVVDSIQKFFSSALGVPNVKVNRAHFLGNPRDKRIIAHIPEDYHIGKIFANTAKLRGTTIYVYRDFTKKVRDLRQKLSKIGRKVKEVAPQERISIVYDHMYVGKSKLEWDQEKLVIGKEDGWAFLEEKYPTVNWRMVKENQKESSRPGTTNRV